MKIFYLSDTQFYGENNQFKRSLSGSEQVASPFKKRIFSQTITPPPHTGLESTDLFQKIDLCEF